MHSMIQYINLLVYYFIPLYTINLCNSWYTTFVYSCHPGTFVYPQRVKFCVYFSLSLSPPTPHSQLDRAGGGDFVRFPDLDRGKSGDRPDRTDHPWPRRERLYPRYCFNCTRRSLGDAARWYYRDQNGEVQGPFDSKQMDKWQDGFPDDLWIRVV